jgi:ABC-2 type transport system ATP-binding protein
MTSRRLQIGAIATLLILLGMIGIAIPSQATSKNQINVTIVGAGVSLDATLYLPVSTPAPAVLLAHGFGGSKDSVVTEAKSLQSRGYVVLAWTARGFGNSTGTISMNSPNGEVADVSKLIDYLSTRSEVIRDSLHDPRVGITGGSYGGALALLAAGYDARIDAVAADITWNDLEGSLFPQSANNINEPGPFKRVWTGTFFSVDSRPSGVRPTKLALPRALPRPIFQN